jgi:hypothetical protein
VQLDYLFLPLVSGVIGGIMYYLGRTRSDRLAERAAREKADVGTKH